MYKVIFVDGDSVEVEADSIDFVNEYAIAVFALSGKPLDYVKMDGVKSIHVIGRMYSKD